MMKDYMNSGHAQGSAGIMAGANPETIDQLTRGAFANLSDAVSIAPFSIAPLPNMLEGASLSTVEISYRITRLANELCGSRPEEDSDGNTEKKRDDSIADRIEFAVDNLSMANARANDAINRIRNRFSLAD